ncbi:MAG: MBL fold metallo-hydrolase [Myxococcota bacterium]
MTLRKATFLPVPLVLLGLTGCGEGDPVDTDLGECPSAPYEPVPLNATPPLPGDACADPVPPQFQVLEATLRTGQAQGDAARAELLDPRVLTVVTCGTGGPLPSDRAQACTAVFAGGRFFVFDAGDGAQASMEDLGLPVADLAAVFLTHFHSDHMADLGEVMSRTWILGRTTPLPIYGGAAIERVVEGFNLAYTADEQYRIAHHGEEVLPPTTLLAEPVRVASSVEGTVVYDEGGVVVRAYDVDHSPIGTALGYRVEYQGRAVGISGDTIDTAGLSALAEGTDILVSEVMDSNFALEMSCALERTGDVRNAAIFRDIRTYHIDVTDLAQVAAVADVGTLVLTHLVPTLPPEQAPSFFETPMQGIYDGQIVVAEDGTQVTLPID